MFMFIGQVFMSQDSHVIVMNNPIIRGSRIYASQVEAMINIHSFLFIKYVVSTCNQ
jgi:hypothetical protein